MKLWIIERGVIRHCFASSRKKIYTDTFRVWKRKAMVARREYRKTFDESGIGTISSSRKGKASKGGYLRAGLRHIRCIIEERGVQRRATGRHCTAVKCIPKPSASVTTLGVAVPGLGVFIIQSMQRASDQRATFSFTMSPRDFSAGSSVLLRIRPISQPFAREPGNRLSTPS